MKKIIIVTGGAGFIGSNFIRYSLTNRPDWFIINLDKLTYAGNLKNLEGVDDQYNSRYKFIHGDICDTKLVGKIFQEYNVSGVIHFAAESHVDRSIKGPQSFVETNVVGTCELLQASLNAWRGREKIDSFRFLHVSTDEVYGSLGHEGAFTEKSVYDPSSPYSASKAASDHFVRAYHRTYGLPTLITNCSNNYGPYQFPEKLIPLIILNVLEEIPLPVYGDGSNVRDWLYVLDHCDALIHVFEQGKPGETYNIGGGTEQTNLQIVKKLCALLDIRQQKPPKTYEKLITHVQDRPGHDFRYAICCDKIKSELGWQAKYKLEDGLESTVNWYLANMEWVNSVRSGDYRKWMEYNYETRSAL